MEVWYVAVIYWWVDIGERKFILFTWSCRHNNGFVNQRKNVKLLRKVLSSLVGATPLHLNYVDKRANWRYYSIYLSHERKLLLSLSSSTLLAKMMLEGNRNEIEIKIRGNFAFSVVSMLKVNHDNVLQSERYLSFN